jgi:ribosome-associated protein
MSSTYIITPKGRQVPRAALTIETSTSGGPGGQHANTSESRVRLTLDLTLCELTEDEMSSLGRKTLVAQSKKSRSQHQNREIATDALLIQLDTLLTEKIQRKETSPSIGSKLRKRKDKEHTSLKKQNRKIIE